MRAMILKEFLELRRDKRTLAMVVVLPLVMLVIFGYAASFDVDELETKVYGPQATEVSDTLRDLDIDGDTPFEITTVDTDADAADARDELRTASADLVIVTDDDTGVDEDQKDQVALALQAAQTQQAGQTPQTGQEQQIHTSTAYIDGSDLFAAQKAEALVHQMSAQAATQGVAVGTEVMFNPDLTTSWIMVPSLVGLILTFIGTIVTALGLVRERQAGTLEQLAIMPFRAVDVIVGKIAPYFVLASIDMVLVTVLGMVLFDVPFVGEVWIFALAAALFLFTVLGVGVLISTVSQNQGQAMQLSLMTVMPQILLSGMIFPIDSMAPGVRWISYVFPLTWFNKISGGVMLRDAPLDSLTLPFVVLACMAVVVFTLAVLRFRRDLAPRMPKVTGAHADDADAVAPGGASAVVPPSPETATKRGRS